MRGHLFVVAALLLVPVATVALPAATGPAVAADAPGDGPGADLASGHYQAEVETDSTRMLVDVGANGSARWEIQYWTRLDDENTTAAFDSLAADVATNPSNYTDRFAARIDGTVGAAANATGREMVATDVAVTTERRAIPEEYGLVRYTFRWSNFAVVSEDELRAGDAVDGLYLPASSRLTIRWPAEYEVVSVEPDADDRQENAAVWRGGQTEFLPGQPRVVLAAGGGGGGGGTSVVELLGALAVLGLAVGAALLARRLRAREPHAQPGGDADAEQTESEAESGSASADGPPPELLSNEERVLQLIEERGGRMKQQEVVEALGWTEAKTSQVVSELREEGDLDGFRLGRENVLTLPEEDTVGDEKS